VSADRTVLVISSQPERLAPRLGEPPPGVRYVFASDLDRLRAAAPDAEIVLFWDPPSPVLRDLWPALRRLRWVQASWAGVDRVLFPELVASPVVLTNAVGVFDPSIAEFVLGLLLAFVKFLPEVLADQRERRWRYRETDSLMDKTLTIVGFGRIGRAVAQRARAFGMRIIGVRRNAAGPDPAADLVLPVERLVEALAQADFVAITAPLTPDTRGLIGAAELAALRPGAYLINVGRGGIVDEAALRDALESGRLRGAALDVVAQEPLPPESPLWTTRNLIITPHIAGDDYRWHDRMAALFRENLRRYLAGEPLLGVVDKQRGY
jgi:phosphoglycerate dehydrogenase-like enzyme